MSPASQSAAKHRSAANKKKVTVESAEAVLGLHWFVARDHTVADEGFEVDIITPGIKTCFAKNDPRTFDHHLVVSTNYQKAFEEGRADIYRACEWGQIRRAYDSKRGSPIVAKRPAMVYQGVFVRPESPVNTPIQLTNKSVGVQFHQGSHYSTLAMLEGFLPRDEIKVIHAGTVGERYEALMAGDVDAVTLMEPWVTLAEKHGCKEIVATHYQGVENAAPEFPREQFKALTRAVNKAVDLFNADKKKHIHYMLEEIPEKYARQLSPDDFHLPRLRYVHAAPYDRDEFERAYNWMVSWDLVGKDASYEKLVNIAI